MSPKRWFRLLGLSCLLIVAGFAVPALTQSTKEGAKYALLVGVRSYDHRKLTDLNFTENDAEGLAEVLAKANYQVTVLTTTRGEKDARKKPTKANIERELKAILKKVTKHDVVLVGLAGHGVQYEVKRDGKRRDESFFCPADARLIDTDNFDDLAETMLSFRALFKQLDDSGAGSRLLLIDACRNDPGTSRNADTDAMPNPTKGTAALFSCKGGERAFESAKLGKGHGIFFYHVIEGLKGKASDGDEVTWDDLTRYVRRNVVKDVPKVVGGGARQTPHLMANVEGDPALLKVGKEVVGKDKDGGTKVVKEEKPSKDKDGGAKIVKGGGDGFTNSIGMKFKRIPKGKFTMGSPRDDTDALKNEQPEHEVEITKDFYLGVYEVTQKQFKDVMGTNPSWFSARGEGAGKVEGIDTDDFPVENVSWEDAQEFIKKLNARAAEKEKGRAYRLPSEAEWEYACRGGVAGKKYHFGDNLWQEDARFNSAFGGRTAKVGSYKANQFGLYDMHGNVQEWCQDWYYGQYYANSPARNPLNLDEGLYRVVRGGGYHDDDRDCRSARRGFDSPTAKHSYLGFRLAVSSSGK